MRKSLRFKLILSFLAVALISVLLISVMIRVGSTDRLLKLAIDQQAATLQADALGYYETNGSWDGFAEYLRTQQKPPDFFREFNQDDQPPEFDQQKGNDSIQHDQRPLVAIIDLDGRLVFSAFGMRVGEILPDKYIDDKIPLELDGETIAYIVPDRSLSFKLSSEEEVFLARTNQAILIAALVGVGAAILMGVILAGVLLKPIRNLRKASQALAAGDLDQRVPVTSQDELGQLSESFNKMGEDLKYADQQRKQMTADITHDLGTPLQVIAGYIEMFEEMPEAVNAKRLGIINTEIEHLRRLLEDLNMLSQADAKAMNIDLQLLDPAPMVEQICHIYQPMCEKEGIRLSFEIQNDLPQIRLDEGRMSQVLKNLVENAMRYTKDNGQIILHARQEEKTIIFEVTDDGTGIDEKDLPHVFDRFYKADPSRTIGVGGKSGLGLAISRALVEAQGGKIKALSAGLGKGTTMKITFPLD